MIYNELFLKKFVNKKLQYMGIDSREHCDNIEHFESYTKDIAYQFNSRGFRDNEWRGDISNNIWCVGDSFSVGEGQPFDEIWSSKLEEISKYNTINISMSGASNDWISRKVRYVIDNIEPQFIVVQWTFIGRRESENMSLPDDKRILLCDNAQLKSLSSLNYYIKNIENFINCFNAISNSASTIIHSFIPNFNSYGLTITDNKFFWDYVGEETNINDSLVIADNTQVDFARDGFHYDKCTSNNYASAMLKFIT
jgi:hypothetical protein